MADARDVEWLMSRRVGVSSKLIWCVMNDVTPERDPFGGYPSDPDDFSRCYLLLQRNPAWRSQLDKLSPRRREWAALVEHWDELERMFLDIFGGTFTEADYDARKPYNAKASERMYARMKEIESNARKRPAAEVDAAERAKADVPPADWFQKLCEQDVGPAEQAHREAHQRSGTNRPYYSGD